MSTLVPPAVAARLPRLLVESSYPPVVIDDIDRAIATTGGRWPVLRPVLKAAAELVRADGVYEAPAGERELALVKLPAAWTFHAVFPSPTGLACTCVGWPLITHAGPGDGLYCADIVAYLLALYLDRALSPLQPRRTVASGSGRAAAADDQSHI